MSQHFFEMLFHSAISKKTPVFHYRKTSVTTTQNIYLNYFISTKIQDCFVEIFVFV